jgi:hypothetical protein
MNSELADKLVGYLFLFTAGLVLGMNLTKWCM